jgi:hypothetical protein
MTESQVNESLVTKSLVTASQVTKSQVTESQLGIQIIKSILMSENSYDISF